MRSSQAGMLRKFVLGKTSERSVSFIMPKCNLQRGNGGLRVVMTNDVTLNVKKRRQRFAFFESVE